MFSRAFCLILLELLDVVRRKDYPALLGLLQVALLIHCSLCTVMYGSCARIYVYCKYTRALVHFIQFVYSYIQELYCCLCIAILKLLYNCARKLFQSLQLTFYACTFHCATVLCTMAQLLHLYFALWHSLHTFIVCAVARLLHLYCELGSLTVHVLTLVQCTAASMLNLHCVLQSKSAGLQGVLEENLKKYRLVLASEARESTCLPFTRSTVQTYITRLIAKQIDRQIDRYLDRNMDRQKDRQIGRWVD